MLRRFVVVLAVMGVLTVASCAPSGRLVATGGGGWANQGDLAIRDVVAVTDGQGAATLVGTVVNRAEGEDQLRSITVPGGRAQMGSLDVPPSGRLQLGLPGPAGETPARITLESNRLKAGRVVSLTFDFRQAGQAEVDAPVVEPSGMYAEVPMPDDPPQPVGDQRHDDRTSSG